MTHPVTDFPQQILESLSTAVVVVDADLRLAYLNSAAEELLDVSAPRLRGKRVDELFDPAALAPEALGEVLATGHPFTDRELTLPLPTGRRVTVNCAVMPLMVAGMPAALVIELQAVDRYLRIAREESLQAQQQAGRLLVRGLAHEVKNPLGGLRGAAQLLERELSDPGLKEYTRIIIGEADRLQALMDRMLGPHTLPHKVAVNIHEVLERVRTLVLAEAPPGVRIVRDYDPSIPELQADRDQLIQAVLNVVRNAAQAVGETGEIQLRTRPVRRFTIGHRCHRMVTRIDIEDDGPGIPAELRENLFYPMVTGRSDGTGLGLSIAQFLIHQHGGLMECESHPGRTIFSCYLPLDNGEDC